MSNNEHSPGPWKIEDRSSWASGGPGDDAHVVDKATGAKALTDEILTGGTPEEFTAASLADLERMTEGE